VDGEAVAAPVEAATVVLLRDGLFGLEVCLQHRKREMVFAPQAWVFPGGKVNEADRLFAQGLRAYPHVMELARRLGNDTARTGALLAAAVRETIEETGIVLGGPTALVAAEARNDLESGACTLTGLLEAIDTTVDLSDIHVWSRWITPISEPRRYDTYFFIAAVPSGTSIGEPNGEASELEWVAIARVLDELRSGTRVLLPPTFTTLRQLASYEDSAAALRAAAQRCVKAGLVREGRAQNGGRVIHLPDGVTVYPDGRFYGVRQDEPGGVSPIERFPKEI
jgi:8-oxo-dGTP pyrophosphatase MutT (NUDIX family)